MSTSKKKPFFREFSPSSYFLPNTTFLDLLVVLIVLTPLPRRSCTQGAAPNNWKKRRKRGGKKKEKKEEKKTPS
jgi:hypothetical protein